MRRPVLLLVLVLAAAVLLNRSARQGASQLPPISAPEERLGPCMVTGVVDGDTIHVNCTGMRDKVRLLRIDTPERGEPSYDEATEALAEMIADEEVYLEFEDPGQLARGRYGRILAYVFLGDLHVNVEMVRQGWSPFWTKYGAGRLASEFQQAEVEARQSRPGRTVSPSSDRGPERTSVHFAEEFSAAGECIPREHCCRICRTGKACGDSCIRRDYRCRKGRGCACKAGEVCP